MAVFFFKIVTLVVRTLARPLINWVGYYNRIRMQESKNIFVIGIRNQLIFLGQTFHLYNSKFNRKLFRLSDKIPIKPLTSEKALERGAELVSEFIVYGILLTIPLYEIIKAYKSGNKKEQSKKDFIANMQNDTRNLIETHENIKNNIKEIKAGLKLLENKIYLV